MLLCLYITTFFFSSFFLFFQLFSLALSFILPIQALHEFIMCMTVIHCTNIYSTQCWIYLHTQKIYIKLRFLFISVLIEDWLYKIPRCLQVLTNWICQVRPYKSYICIMVLTSLANTKNVSDAGWFHTFTEFQNCSDIGWGDVWSRWCFPPCSFRSCAAEIKVARLHNNFWVSHLVVKIELCKNLSLQQRCQENVHSKTAG